MLYDWEAKRSGANITISGKDETGQVRAITGVERVALTANGLVAVTLARKFHPLATTSGPPQATSKAA